MALGLGFRVQSAHLRHVALMSLVSLRRRLLTSLRAASMHLRINNIRTKRRRCGWVCACRWAFICMHIHVFFVDCAVAGWVETG